MGIYKEFAERFEWLPSVQGEYRQQGKMQGHKHTSELQGLVVEPFLKQVKWGLIYRNGFSFLFKEETFILI